MRFGRNKICGGLTVKLAVSVTVLVAAAMFFGGCRSFCPQTVRFNKEISMKPFGKAPYGDRAGETVYLYTLTNARGAKATITNYGGIMTSLYMPDRNGVMEDIVLGFDNLAQYTERHPYFGSTIGRYGNRIAGGRFTLDGVEYQLATNNNGINHLHGGNYGFDRMVWDAEPVTRPDAVGLKLSRVSKDMEEGYPGNLNVTVTYWLTDDNAIELFFEAQTDKATPINLTHHSYFNLTAARDNVLGHVITINADRYTVVNDTLIPTGELRSVAGTPMDFRKPHTIGSRIGQVPGGYDHNYVLNRTGDGLEKIAEVYEPKSGRVMEVLTTEPGVQFYTGNFLDGSQIGKGGIEYKKNFGVCFEPQHFPDSPNQPTFPSAILRPGETYFHHTVYKFSTR